MNILPKNTTIASLLMQKVEFVKKKTKKSAVALSWK